jgi:hypothetical protein
MQTRETEISGSLGECSSRGEDEYFIKVAQVIKQHYKTKCVGRNLRSTLTYMGKNSGKRGPEQAWPQRKPLKGPEGRAGFQVPSRSRRSSPHCTLYPTGGTFQSGLKGDRRMVERGGANYSTPRS